MTAASEQHAKPELIRLICGFICVHACMAGVRMTSPLLALELGYSAAAVGVMLALFALTQVFLSIPAGRFVDRHGLKRPVGMAVAAACCGTLLAFCYQWLPVLVCLCAAALLCGGSAGMVAISLQRHVGRLAKTPTELKKMFSWLALGPAISNFLGPFIAGLIIDHVGFQAAYGTLAVLPLIGWACIRGTGNLPPVEGTVVAEKGSKPKAVDLLADPMFRRLLLVNWFLASSWDVHTFVIPILGHDRGLSASIIGTILGAFAIAAATVRVLLPLLASRIKEWAVMTLAMVFTAVLFGVYPLLSSAWSMGLCSVLLGFVLGSVQPMVMSMLHQITPASRHGEALGLRLMTINASSVLMPILFGSAGAVIGISGVFWVIGGVVAVGTRSAWRLRVDKTPR